MWKRLVDYLTPYIRFDSNDEIENVHQSPPRTTKLTFQEKIRLVPQYIAAISLYLDLCFVYYSAITLGGLPLAIAFIYGFYSEVVTPFTIGCALFVGHFIASIISLKLFFSNKERVRWLYDLIGEDRVRPKAFASPAISAVASKGVKVILAMGAVDAATHAAAATVESGQACFNSFVNERRFENQTAKHVERIQEISQSGMPAAQIKEAFQLEKKIYEHQEQQYENAAKKISSQPHTAKGLFRSIVSAEVQTHAITEASKGVRALFGRGN